MIPCRRHDARGYQGSPPAVNTVFVGSFPHFSTVTEHTRGRKYVSIVIIMFPSSCDIRNRLFILSLFDADCALFPSVIIWKFSGQHFLIVLSRWNSEAMRRLCSQCQMVIIHFELPLCFIASLQASTRPLHRSPCSYRTAQNAPTMMRACTCRRNFEKITEASSGQRRTPPARRGGKDTNE